MINLNFIELQTKPLNLIHNIDIKPFPTRVFDILDYIQKDYKRFDALSVKRNKKWDHFSTSDYVDNSNLVSYGLLALGLKKGDKIATVSNNRPEWNFMDMGMMQIGVIHVPVYPTISDEEYKFILHHCDAKILIISDKQLYTRIKPISDKISTIESVYSFNEIEGAKNWIEIIELGKQNQNHFAGILKEIKSEIVPNDIASIIYTSGTTGNSKGVMLTHNNLISNLRVGIEALTIDHRHKILSFLPLCHVYERLLNYVFQVSGIGIYYAESMGTIIDDMKDIKPDGFDTVPRLLEKVYATILGKGKNLKGIKKIIFNFSIYLGKKFDYKRKNSLIYGNLLKIIDKLVFTKWREALGGNVKFIGCGGAALQTSICRIFWAAGIPIQEGYGLTETSPLIAINFPELPNKKFGTVGVVLRNVQVKIANDGEILVKGPNVMKGYYKNEEMTQEVIDQEGWFHTGDIGELVEGKYLKITDRKKEIFKLSSGKYVAPAVLESKLKESLWIENAMVFGENEKFASALILPNFAFVKSWAEKKNIETKELDKLIQNPDVLAKFQKEVAELNKKLGSIEEIKRFKLVADEWSIQSGEFSAKMNLKRKFIMFKYKNLVKEIYNTK